MHMPFKISGAQAPQPHPKYPVKQAVVQGGQAGTRCSQISAGVLTPAVREGERFTFTMCNPPFFESMEEAGQNPATSFSGTAAEMVCPGGELAFVSRMIADSLELKVSLATFLSCTVL